MPKKPFRSSGRPDNRRDKPERSGYPRGNRDERSDDKPKGNTRYGSKRNESSDSRPPHRGQYERGNSRGPQRPDSRGNRDDSKRDNPTGRNFSQDRSFSKKPYTQRDGERRDNDFSSNKYFGNKPDNRFNDRPDNRSGDDRERRPFPSRDDNNERPFNRRDDDRRGGDGERKPFQRNEGGSGKRYFPKNHPGDFPGSGRSASSEEGSDNRKNDHFARREDDRSRSYNQRRDYGDQPSRPSDDESSDAPHEVKPFENRDEQRPSQDRDERTPYQGRGERQPYNRGDNDERKPFREREDRPSFDNRDERRPPYREERRPSANDNRYNPRRSTYGQGDNQFKPSEPSFDPRREEREQSRSDRFDRNKSSYDDRRGESSRKRFNPDERRSENAREDDERPAPKTGEDGTLRLNKYIANAGICSRREADEHIASGEVNVNGKVVTEMGYRVKPDDKITYRGKRVQFGKKVYILMNKPKDFITTTSDEKDRKTVMDIIGDATEERVYPVGRLDRNTTGLLLLTNDGELAQKLMHPSFRVRKVYQVTLDKPVAKEDMERIAAGVDLEDGKALVDEVAYADIKDKRIIGIDLHVGKNRIVRRIFESLGYEVLYLDRVLYADFTKKDLPRGKWRFLDEKEIRLLGQHMKRTPRGKSQG